MLREKNEMSFQFFLDNPQYFKGSTVIKNKLRRYNKTLRAVNYLLGLIGYIETNFQELKPQTTSQEHH